MVKKFGIEGLLTIDPAMSKKVAIEALPDKEQAKIVYLDGSKEP